MRLREMISLALGHVSPERWGLVWLRTGMLPASAWPHSCLFVFCDLSCLILTFLSLVIWWLSFVGTDRRQTLPGGQPWEGNLHIWADRTRHVPGSDTMGEVRKEANVSFSRVVFSKMDTFLASLSGHGLTSPQNLKTRWQRGSVPGALHTWSHFVTKSRAPSGRCHWLLLHMKKLEVQRGYMTCPRPQSSFQVELI